MFVSFGPQPDQYRAYAGPKRKELPAGTTGPVTDVATFYNDTRGKSFRATFSLLSALGPLAAFAATVWLLASMLSGDGRASDSPLVDGAEIPPLPIDAFCGSPEAHGALLNAAFAQTVRFSATHVGLLAICAVTFVVSAASTLNVLGTHRAPRRWRRRKLARWTTAVAVPLAGAALAYAIAERFVGSQIAALFGRLFPIADPANDCGVLRDALRLKASLDSDMQLGAFCVAAAVASLIVAAACLAHRYERNDINGPWSDSYVLRHKLNTLLTLFFVGSITLVATNVALSSAMDWSNGLLDVVSDSTGFEPADAQKPHDAGTAANSPAKAQAEAFASIKTLKTSVGSFAGSLGSLLLIAIFVPALYSLTSEVEFAGKCHAFFDSRSGDSRQIVQFALDRAGGKLAALQGSITSETQPPDDPGRIVVAGWKTVQDWKERHGLKLSFSDLTGSFVAVLAPLLSSSVIDLTKIAVGSG